MLKYKLRKIGRKKIIFWSATMLIFLISMTSIIRYYAYSASFSPANSGNSGINNTTVYVNDWEKEYNYYMSLNYTEIISPTAVPSGTNTNRYNNENLIPFEITYDGQDINNSSLTGYVSYLNTERQSKYDYYKYFVLKDNKVKIPLIDNPFSSRPMVNGTGYGFNGWVCNATNTSDINVGDTENKVDICSRATLSYDDDYYQRYITIDLNGLDYTKGIQLYLNAFWIPARVYALTTNNNLNNSGLYAKTMQPIAKTDQDVRVYYQEYVFYSYGFKNGVTYYIRQGNNYVQNTAPYNAGTTYYIRENNNYRQAVQNDFDRLYRWEDRNVSVGTRSNIGYQNTSSLYYRVNSSSNNNPLFYTSGGAVCGENNCDTVGYKLIQTTDNYNDLYHDYDYGAYNTNPERTNPQEGDRSFTRCTIGGTNSATCEVNNNGINFDSFYYLVTRDTNIVHLTSNNNVSYNSNYISNNNPFTVSSCPFGNTCTIRTINNGTFNANNDVRFENVRTSGSNGSNFNANNHNVKIGRNINGANPTNNFANEFVGSNAKYTIIIESGSYNNITLANGNATGIAAVGHFGSDYDRVSGDDIDGVNGGNNHKFLVKNRLRATNPTYNNYKNSGDPMVPFSDMYVYSGCIACDNNYQWKNNIDDSIYMGFAAEDVQWTSLSYLTIYGGYIKAIYGGSGFNSGTVTNVNATSVHMLGGTVGTIFGGARKRGLYGHRIISISGGNIVFNIFGVSNSYDGSMGEAGGISNDNSLVYIGGSALIGATPDEGTNYTGQYYTVNAPTGSVFGGGAGGANYPGTGTVKNSHVIINGGEIKGDVFGGGNYGATGDTFDEETTTKIDIYDGTIHGSVYGGANRNGAGNSPTNSNCSCGAGNNVCLNDNYYYIATGNVVSFYNNVPRNTYYYNGSTITSSGNRAVTCYTWDGCPTFNRVGIGTAYNSGTTYYNQYYQNVSPNTCTVSTGLVAMKHNITITMTGGTVEHSVYGGANITGTAYANIKLDMIGGTVEQDVFGGGRGETQNNAHNGNIVMGNIEVNAKGTKIRDVYGGSALGRVNGSGTANEEDKTGYTTKVNVSAGDIRDVYGCGMGADSGNPNNPYAYPYTNGQTTVTITGGSMSNVYGGNNSSGKAAYPTQVELLGGTITGNAFGGGNNVGHGVTNIHLAGTTINTYVDPADNEVKGGNVFGGSNNNGVVTLTNVVIDSGTVRNVFGGNNLGGNADETRVIFNSANISENVYGSGLRASSRATNVTINSGEVKNVFGGGLNAGVTEKSKVLIKNNAKVTEGVYGGSNASGTVANSYVYVSGTNGKIGNVFGGNNIGGKTTNSHVYIGGGSVTNVYGGGNQVNTGTTNVYVYSGTMDKVFGGDNNVPEPDPGDGDPTYTNSTDVYVYGGTVPYVFGGSNIQGRVDEAKVTIEDNPPACTVDNSAGTGEVVDPCYENSTRNVTDVFGGNNEGGLVNDTIVNIKDTAYLNDVFGGGNEAKVLNSTTVNMYAGNVYNVARALPNHQLGC